MRTRSRITLRSFLVALTALTTLGVAAGPAASATPAAPPPGATISDLGIRTTDFRFTSPTQVQWTVEVQNFGPQNLNQNPMGNAGYGIQAFLPSGVTCTAPPNCFLIGPEWQRVVADSRFLHTFFLAGVDPGDRLDLRLSFHLGTLQGDNEHPDSVSRTA